MHFTLTLRAWRPSALPLLGMSGVGKTHLRACCAARLVHFSGDYRIGTRYLDEPIL